MQFKEVTVTSREFYVLTPNIFNSKWNLFPHSCCPTPVVTVYSSYCSKEQKHVISPKLPHPRPATPIASPSPPHPQSHFTLAPPPPQPHLRPSAPALLMSCLALFVNHPSTVKCQEFLCVYQALTRNSLLFHSFFLKCISHTVIFTHSKHTIQEFLVYSQNCAAITSM